MQRASDAGCATAPGPTQEQGFWDKLKGAVSEVGGMRERVAELKKAATQLAERPAYEASDKPSSDNPSCSQFGDIWLGFP